ncbi:MAG: LysR family transcriptional regulator [Rhodocyclaceae bacterium]|nr:LysR family transcriptional regulator [Rhodocyclaceae bacterium]
MTPHALNFRHLLYFWAVAKDGSIVRAAQRLGLSSQTISTQLGLLERQLGQVLLAPQGRSLELTDSGRTALAYAEEIFLLGDKLVTALSEPQATRARFAVGITDAVPKLVAFEILRGVIAPPLSVRLECIEGDLDKLLAELALNHIDLVIADRPAPQRANLKLHSHLLLAGGVDLFAAEALHRHYAPGFPGSLDGAPLLLPTRDVPLRGAIDAWLDARELRPCVVGEFSDSALLKTFGRAGAGIFPAPSALRRLIAEQYAADALGTLDGVRETWHAITAHRRLPHPAVLAIEAMATGPGDVSVGD